MNPAQNCMGNEMAKTFWRGLGRTTRDRGRGSASKRQKILKYLAIIAVKHNVDAYELLNCIGEAWSLNYTPNLVARRLSIGKTLVVAVIVPFFTRPGFSERLNGIVSVLSQTEYVLVDRSLLIKVHPLALLKMLV